MELRSSRDLVYKFSAKNKFLQLSYKLLQKIQELIMETLTGPLTKGIEILVQKVFPVSSKKSSELLVPQLRLTLFR